jgi:hypothetical protein
MSITHPHMAVDNSRGSDAKKDYSSCIITPMSEDDAGRPLVKPVHVVDAFIVAGVIFFSLLLGTSIPALIAGQSAYISPTDIQNRFYTAVIAFFLTFFAQWARYRGLKVMNAFNGSATESGGNQGNN